MADLKGLKRICMSCGARFYDLNKKPIICPNCSTEYTGEIKVKSRRGRLPADVVEDSQVDEDTAATEIEEDDSIEEIEQDEETVSLDELEEDSDDGDEDAIDIDDEDLEDLDEEDLDDLDDDEIEEDIAEEDDEK